MIDTVILRLHDVGKYEALIRRLNLNNKTGYTTQTAKIDPDEVSRLRQTGIKEAKDIIEIMQIQRTGEFLVKTQVGKQMNASSHYSFTYFVDFTRNHIEFNFSIPKYKFGSNVLMFVEHMLDRDFRYGDSSLLEHNIKRAPRLFKAFIHNFLKTEFIETNIDLYDVEVHRIDVCFNQVFKSKADALLYLDYQKRLKKKYAKDEEGVMREYASSLMYVTKRYSAKIYHKGSEYLKNDLKEHQRINKEKGIEYFKTGKFQELADKILRYELTIRNGYINYLFKHNLFRRDCRFFKMDYKVYTRVGNSMQKNDRISKKTGLLNEQDKESFLKLNPYDRIDKNDRKTYKYIAKILERRTFFRLAVNDYSELYNRETVNYSCDDAKLTGHIVYFCLQKLLSFITEFQIKELPDEDLIERKIDLYNSMTRKKLPKSDMLHFYSILLKYGSFKEAGKYGGYSRATLYRYKSRFKAIGISETSIKPLENNLVPEAPIDLKEYHSILMYENNLLRGIKIN